MVGLLVLSIRVLRKGARKPSRLDLRAGASARQVPVERRRSAMMAAAQPQAKALNVVFNYNGYAWDAYEVLGVPAGSSIEAVTKAYEGLRSQASTDSRAFLDAAYAAVLNET